MSVSMETSGSIVDDQINRPQGDVDHLNQDEVTKFEDLMKREDTDSDPTSIDDSNKDDRYHKQPFEGDENNQDTIARKQPFEPGEDNPTQYQEVVDAHNDSGFSANRRHARDGVIGGRELAGQSGITGEDNRILRYGLGNFDGKLDSGELKTLADSGIIDIAPDGKSFSLTMDGRRVLETVKTWDKDNDYVLTANDNVRENRPDTIDLRFEFDPNVDQNSDGKYSLDELASHMQEWRDDNNDRLGKFTDAVDFHNEQGSGIADDKRIGGVELTNVSNISVKDANSLRLGIGNHDGKIEAWELAQAEDLGLITVNPESHEVSITSKGSVILESMQHFDTNKDGVIDKNDDSSFYNIEKDMNKDGRIDLDEFEFGYEESLDDLNGNLDGS